jgi:hypothetical protein
VERWQCAREISQEESIQRWTGIHVQPVPAPARAGQGKDFLLTLLLLRKSYSRMSGARERESSASLRAARARGEKDAAAKLALVKSRKERGAVLVIDALEAGKRDGMPFAVDSRGLDATALGLCPRRLPFDPAADFPRRLDRRRHVSPVHGSAVLLVGVHTAAARAATAATRRTLDETSLRQRHLFEMLRHDHGHRLAEMTDPLLLRSFAPRLHTLLHAPPKLQVQHARQEQQPS